MALALPRDLNPGLDGFPSLSSGLLCGPGSAQRSPGSVQPQAPSLGSILSYGLVFPAYLVQDVGTPGCSPSLPAGVVPFPSHSCGRRALPAAPQGPPVSKVTPQATKTPRERPECPVGNTPGHGAVPAATTRAQIPAFLLREERKAAGGEAVPSLAGASPAGASPVLIQGCHLPSAPAASATA